MISLDDLLDQTSHRGLELLARAHGLPFSRREPKAQGLAVLRELLRAGAYERAFETLDAAHIEALQALLVADGWLPLYLFEAHFGKIRAWRPWRGYSPQVLGNRGGDNPRHPWRYPVSVAERLFHLGYIHIRAGQMVGIVREAEDITPSLPSPEATHQGRGLNAGTRSDLLRDVSALLGTLLHAQARALHGRWLSLSMMRVVNERLCFREDLRDVRSELQTKRLKLLHYLAQVAGLLSVESGAFLPTAAAWRWLSADAQTQWDTLMAAVEHDLSQHKNRLWDQFRLPDVRGFTFVVLRQTLDALKSEQGYRVRDVLMALKPYLLPDTRYNIACTLRDFFAPAGVVVLARGRVFLRDDLRPAAQSGATIIQQSQQIVIQLPKTHSKAFTELLSFAQIEDDYAIIDAQAASIALRAGLDAAGIIALLAQLTGAPIKAAIQEQIAAWMQAAGQITLQKMVVLHVQDTEVLRQIRVDWRLAGYFTEKLSPHHLAVKAEDAHALLSRLKRRGYAVTSLLPASSPRHITDKMTADMAEYLLLATRVYQHLHAKLGASTRIPMALVDWLHAQIDDPAQIEAEALALVTAAYQDLPQKSSALAASVPQAQDVRTIYRLLRFAQRQRRTITMDYLSPYVGRSVTHKLDIRTLYDSGDLTYIDAYCHVVGDWRTFRLDRVQRVHEAAQLQDAV